MYIFGYPANGQGVDTLGSPPKGLFQFGRDFLKKYYPELKTLNPGLPIYVRPCDGVDAKVLARYERGVYEAQDVNGKSAEGILNVVKELAEQAAVVNARLSTKYGTNGDLRIPEVVQ
mmetsp:Transcript_686/g.1627  ORF Transcript_686/g.1627 Transcript_686/m.1627 type:complete len:117 (+) Transcript_686:367-717(+)